MLLPLFVIASTAAFRRVFSITSIADFREVTNLIWTLPSSHGYEVMGKWLADECFGASEKICRLKSENDTLWWFRSMETMSSTYRMYRHSVELTISCYSLNMHYDWDGAFGVACPTLCFKIFGRSQLCKCNKEIFWIRKYGKSCYFWLIILLFFLIVCSSCTSSFSGIIAYESHHKYRTGIHELLLYRHW